MCKNCEKIAGIAESVKAEIVYDMKFNISPVDFYRTKFDKNRNDEKKLCAIIYKKVN